MPGIRGTIGRINKRAIIVALLAIMAGVIACLLVWASFGGFQ